MKTKIILFLTSAMLALTPACKKKEEAGKDDNAQKPPPAQKKDDPKTAEPTDDKAAADKSADGKSAADKNKPGVAAVVQLKVKSYDAWKGVFDKGVEQRKAGGILGHHINQGAEDPNLVTLYLPLSDPAKFKAFTTSEGLKKTMAEAGVAGPPQIWVVNTTIREAILDKGLPAIIVMHEVEDFAAWRKVYENFDAERKKLGITGHAVNQAVDNPNMVVVYHQADTLDVLKKFVESPRLKEVMKEAGVKSKPEISFHNAPGAAVMY